MPEAVVGLREFVKEHRMTQEQFADSIGMRREHVSRVMNGKVDISDEFIGRFARIYGFELAALIFGHNGTVHAEEQPA